MSKLKLLLLITLVFCLNLLIYITAGYTEEMDLVFAECARNSGRTSAALNLILLVMLGHWGLKSIYKDETKKNLFQTLVTLFAVNHLVHFFFVSQNFDIQNMELDISHNLHGFITFVSLVLLPIVLFIKKKLNKTRYVFTLIHFFNITYFISETFYGRYKPVDQAYLHRLGILVMIGALAYIIYRVYQERKDKFAS